MNVAQKSVHSVVYAGQMISDCPYANTETIQYNSIEIKWRDISGASIILVEKTRKNRRQY